MSEYWSETQTQPQDGQLNLFESAPVTRRESLHRSAAAKSAHRPGLVDRSGQAGQVLDCIRNAGPGGLTRHEIATLLGLPLSSVCGRVNELLNETNPAVYVAADRRNGRSILIARAL